MSVPNVLLGLLEDGPQHGYQLKQSYDGLFGKARTVNFGQIYTALKRLQLSGRVRVQGTESGRGPERKLYGITPAGVTDVERWLKEPESPQPHLQSVFFAKVLLALLSERPAHRFLEAQRAVHLAKMREVMKMKQSGSVTDALLADYALFHLEADLRWIELTSGRLEKLRRDIHS